MKRANLTWLLAALLSACGVEAIDASGEPLGVAAEEFSTTVSAKVDGLKITLERDVAAVDFEGRTLWVIRGRSNTDLTRAFSFICDDALGGTTLVNPRTFEVAFEWRDFEVALAPRTLYLAFTTVAGFEAYATYTVAPRLTSFSGSNKIWVEADITPRVVEGVVHYVGEFTTSKLPTSVNVYNDIDTDPAVLQLAPKRWEFDWSSITQLLSQPMGGAPLFFRAEFADGSAVQKQAQLLISVPSLSLSTTEPY